MKYREILKKINEIQTVEDSKEVLKIFLMDFDTMQNTIDDLQQQVYDLEMK